MPRGSDPTKVALQEDRFTRYVKGGRRQRSGNFLIELAYLTSVKNLKNSTRGT
jgi:hypothetical protein